jgi:HAD superfamily hydrolase (TIGR01490 family)
LVTDRGAEATAIAAFDFDGTLVPGDSFGPFLLRLRGRGALLGSLARSAPAMAFAYRRAGRDGAKAALLERAVHGVSSKAAHQAGSRFGAELVSRVRPDLAQRLEWHRLAGHRLVLVSASLSLYLEPFADAVGFDDVIATRLEEEGGYLTGRLHGQNVRGAEKAARLRQLVGPDVAELWAYGDSAGDRQLLEMADHPTWIRRTRLITPPPSTG